MKHGETLPILFCAMLFASTAQAQESPATAQIRCGWFDNPTPGNASLYDRDGEWIIGIQGGHQADGDWPEFSDSQWVDTNGHHGHGCACLDVVTSTHTHEIIRITGARAKALKICRNDRTLKEPD
ncbi:DUF4087 domain-containing protein [Rhodanobacter sp. C01]|uniref:DUF4087 domain-containing protein n=1 Tax=Rhodanobacter sp. C01 TaxID=1945856 RepID=UPI000985D469|nr:DUF4087 domain-containing protein [Rhodanobacter sp. C01]OOG45928.1 hypothetical protein B0E50_17440 [Rhodanobacter sp. C01]